MRTGLFRYYLRIYQTQFKNNWVREASYRFNFLSHFATDLIWMSVEYSLFSVIYANVSTLGGWTRQQVFFFLGIFFAADACFTIFFQSNFWNFSRIINRGDLDLYLTKPANTLFLLFSREIHLYAILGVAFGVAIAARYADAAGFAGGLAWLRLPLWLACALAIQWVLRFAFAVPVFWMERSTPVAMMYYHLHNLGNKPDVIYPRWLRWVLRTALPFAFIASVPARALLQGISSTELAVLAASLLCLGTLDYTLWRRGLRRYQSASS